MVIKSKYGSWDSPITASILQKNNLNYTYLCVDQNENVKRCCIYWIEMRPTENGRYVVVSKDFDRNPSMNENWTPELFSAKTRVHEYGGADIFVYDGIVYFSNENDQQLYMQKQPQSQPEKVSQNNCCRYANGFYYGRSGCIYIVREDHTDENNVKNTIVMIKDHREVIVVEGADFYASPRVSSNGEFLCWIEWNFPNMPWDNTKVCIVKIDNATSQILTDTVQMYASSADSNPVSCMLPMWARDNSLLYINDKTGFWNIWISKEPDNQINLTPTKEDIGGPMWSLDYRTYYYHETENVIVLAKAGGQLQIMKTDGSIDKTLILHPHITSIAYPYLMHDGSIVAIGGSPDSSKTIYRIFSDDKYEIVGRNRTVEGVDPQYFSIPQLLSYPVPGGISYAYYYQPCNPDYCGLPDTLPPLLVLAHGGPTSAADLNLKLSIQYWTSRGFAVLDVDYRGSSGYGKEYRNLLKGNWGILDKVDCCEGANYLVSQKLVDGNKLAISGKSAGGYTTLCCLTFSSTFKTGCSIFGIGDLKTLAEDTHKFESKYMDILIGDYKECNHLYHERSPINFPENIKCAMIFYQGTDDKVVPKEQSEKMFHAVKSTGFPCSLILYEGERHGFRKSENIIHQLESEYFFYGKMFGFETPNLDDSIIVIENFPCSK